MSGLSYFMPLFLWLLVFVIVLAVLMKTGLLGSQLLNFIVAFIVASIFASLASTREYIKTVTPWLAVILVAMLFVLLIIGLSKQDISAIMKPWLVWIFIMALIFVFLLSAFNVFPNLLWNLRGFFINKSKIVGAFILLITGILVAWFVTKG